MKISPKSTNFVNFGVFFWIAIQAILLTGQLITSLITTGIFSTDKVILTMARKFEEYSLPFLLFYDYFTCQDNLCRVKEMPEHLDHALSQIVPTLPIS
jgi:hypothetical protein